MAKIIVRIGNAEPLQAEPLTTCRMAMAEIATTSNLASDTVANGLAALDRIGGAGDFADVLAKAGKPDDVIQILIDGELKAEYLRQNFAKRIHIALQRGKWTGKIFTTRKEKEDATPQVMPDMALLMGG